MIVSCVYPQTLEASRNRIFQGDSDWPVTEVWKRPQRLNYAIGYLYPGKLNSYSWSFTLDPSSEIILPWVNSTYMYSASLSPNDPAEIFTEDTPSEVEWFRLVVRGSQFFVTIPPADVFTQGPPPDGILSTLSATLNGQYSVTIEIVGDDNNT